MGRAAWVAAMVALACAACDQPAPPSRAPTPTVSTSPAVDLRLAAATAYAAALAARTQGMAAVDAACGVATTTAALQDCWSRREQVQAQFNRAFDAIRFPAANAAEVAALQTIDRRLDAAMAGLATAADPRADRADDSVISGAGAYFLAGSVTLRTELGIPTASPTP
jgi:hypothetical protein